MCCHLIHSSRSPRCHAPMVPASLRAWHDLDACCRVSFASAWYAALTGLSPLPQSPPRPGVPKMPLLSAIKLFQVCTALHDIIVHTACHTATAATTVVVHTPSAHPPIVVDVKHTCFASHSCQVHTALDLFPHKAVPFTALPLAAVPSLLAMPHSWRWKSASLTHKPWKPAGERCAARHAHVHKPWVAHRHGGGRRKLHTPTAPPPKKPRTQLCSHEPPPHHRACAPASP
jgi:hypothetical protein